jgi:hypothetical protein
MLLSICKFAKKETVPILNMSCVKYEGSVLCYLQLPHYSLSCENRMRSGLTAPPLILSHFFAASRTALFNFAHPSQLKLQWASCT